MAQNPIVYEWECPVCGHSSVSMAHLDRTPVDDQAANAIRGHVQQTRGEGHGDSGEFPPGFGDVEIADYVRSKEQFGGRAAP